MTLLECFGGIFLFIFPFVAQKMRPFLGSKSGPPKVKPHCGASLLADQFWRPKMDAFFVAAHFAHFCVRGTVAVGCCQCAPDAALALALALPEVCACAVSAPAPCCGVFGCCKARLQCWYCVGRGCGGSVVRVQCRRLEGSLLAVLLWNLQLVASAWVQVQFMRMELCLWCCCTF